MTHPEKLTILETNVFDTSIETEPAIGSRAVAGGLLAVATLASSSGFNPAAAQDGPFFANNESNAQLVTDDLDNENNLYRSIERHAEPVEIVHIVKEGETPLSIAQLYGKNTDEIDYRGHPRRLPIGKELEITIDRPYAVDLKDTDTLASISEITGLPKRAIITANNLDDGLPEGTLIIPIETKRTITIEEGDTLSSIAQNQGHTIETITAANLIDNPDRIFVGQKIIVPSNSEVIYRPKHAKPEDQPIPTTEVQSDPEPIIDQETAIPTNTDFEQPTTPNHAEQRGFEVSKQPTIIELSERNAKPPFVWPIRRNENQFVSSCYNDSRDGGVRGHGGIDIAGDIGTPIIAPFDGKIVFDRWVEGYGNLTIIEHSKLRLNGQKISTLYAHNNGESTFSEGDEVKQGEVFQYLGNTGVGTGPHLHFGVYAGLPAGTVGASRSTVTLNPLNFFSDEDVVNNTECIPGPIGDTIDPWDGTTLESPDLSDRNRLIFNDNAPRTRIKLPDGVRIRDIAISLKEIGKFQHTPLDQLIDKIIEDSTIDSTTDPKDEDHVFIDGLRLIRDEREALIAAAKASLQNRIDSSRELDSKSPLDLITPPNLGPVNSEGYYLMPANPSLYVFSRPGFPRPESSGSPKSSRCADLETIRVAYTVASEWLKFNDNKLILGDFNEGEGHATHRNGVDFDIYDVGQIATSIDGDYRKSVELAILLARTNRVESIYFNNHRAIEVFNDWATENGYITRMEYFPNHDHHFHVNILPEYTGQYSETCAPDTQYNHQTNQIAAQESKRQERIERRIRELRREMIAEAPVLRHLSNEYFDVLKQKPSLRTARAEYDFWRTGEVGPQIPKVDVALLAYAAGWRGEDLVIATALGIDAEGARAPFVVNTQAGTYDNFDDSTIAVGLLQILDTPDFDNEPHRDAKANLDPWNNVKAAYIIFQSQGWHDGWEAVSSQLYLRSMNEAREVVARMLDKIDK